MERRRKRQASQLGLSFRPPFFHSLFMLCDCPGVIFLLSFSKGVWEQKKKKRRRKGGENRQKRNPEMAKQKNHTNHNQNRKNHKNKLRKPSMKKSFKGCYRPMLKNMKFARLGQKKIEENSSESEVKEN